MEKFLRGIEKLLPKSFYQSLQPIYHFSLAFLGALIYGFPSQKMTVIGVTGTKGKTTTCNLIAQILNSAGHKTGMATTVNFRIGDREWTNETKQTMLGRFQLQRLLRQMAKEGCKYAVIETSSEGILQFRHRFINYNIAVFTNISPEHIERHGGFENYRLAKIKLFQRVAQKKNGIGIFNLDDPNISFFLEPKIKTKYGYTLKRENKNWPVDKVFYVSNAELLPSKTRFQIENNLFEMPLLGEMNVYNAAAAIGVALSQNIPGKEIKSNLREIKPLPGRLEILKSSRGFSVVIDYAHEPASLEATYKTIANIKKQKAKMVCLLGSQGGGRDKWKRAEMGKIAAKYCDKIILTNEDPYDENPEKILDDIEAGFSQISNSKFQIAKNYWKIIDRQEAIRKAISLGQKDDFIILTGKGGEVWMCIANGKKIPWSDRDIAEKELEKIKISPDKNNLV